VSYESRTYDNEHGDPVVVLVVTGTHDVSRLVNTLNGSVPVLEQMDIGRQIMRQVRRHNGGAAALRLLKAHGGPDFTDESPEMRAITRLKKAHEDELRRYVAQERGRDVARESEVAS
jgi:hypothetical protein